MPSKKSTAGNGRDASLMMISTTLGTLQRGYRAAVDKAVAHVGLSQALALPLVMIGRHGDGLRPGVLAALLGIEGPSLVRSLAQLADAGFVEYREDAVDGRAKTLYLTATGAAARARIEEVLHELRTGLYEGVADADLAACLRVFSTLEQRLGRKTGMAGLTAPAMTPAMPPAMTPTRPRK